jgi:hypothetical protein
LIPYEKKDHFILFILDINSLKKLIDYIIKGRGFGIIPEKGIILMEGIILLNDDGKREGLGEEVLIDLRYSYLI